MDRVIPTVFAYNKKEFLERLERILPVSKAIQIDIGDGKFVEFKSIEVKEIPDLKRYRKNFELHLMTINPEEYLEIAKKKGFKKIIFHYEAVFDNHKVFDLIKRIRAEKMQVFLGVNPETHLTRIIPFLRSIDGVLLMGVHPGREHRAFLPRVYKKIKELRAFNSEVKIQIDGGVNPETAVKLKKLGVNIINSGSFVGDAKNPKIAIEILKQVFA